jgi:uncharacterized protein
MRRRDNAEAEMKMPMLLAAIGGLMIFASPADAASFNCGKAAAADEIAICRTTVLSELDVAMATLYGVRMQIPMLMGARGAAQDEQRAFLQSRASCGSNVACIQSAYQQRNGALNATIAAAMQDYCRRLGICG